MPLRNLTVILFAAVTSMLCYTEANRSRYAHRLSEVIDTISSHYVKDVDSRELYEGGIEGMIERLDPYSGYISPDDYAQFETEMRQRFGGIGIEVGLRNEQLTVLSPLPGSPAYDAGVLAGDLILAVDGKSTKGFKMRDAVGLIQGEPGTTVKLTVQHKGDTDSVDINVTRAIIKVESIRGDRRNDSGVWDFTLQDHPRIAHVRILKFAEKTAEELRATLDSLRGKIDGLVIDLRGNAGGLLTGAVEICDMFVEKGSVIVSIKGRHGTLQQEYVAVEDAIVDPSLPIAVLVDSFSASASEIFAACLQDNKRAKVIGERTWGKGTVQNVIQLDAGKSALRLTTATYWRPSGKNIHRHVDDDTDAEWGVQPLAEDHIQVTPEETKEMWLQRRDRDVLPPNSGTERTMVKDARLEHAIQYLQNVIAESGEKNAA